MRTVLAWGDNVGFWDQFGHGLGAFVTSPGVAGLAAVAAAVVAAWQVALTRNKDERARQQQRKDEESARAVDAAAQRQSQLWERFTWVINQAATQNIDTVVALLEVVEQVARAENDAALIQLIEQQRDAFTVELANKLEEGGLGTASTASGAGDRARAGDEPEAGS
ncbi:hypothetical protein [Williamsia serinedens]|uniref:Uncharacterized protein n=1 Tax=Williamsia serinedens TaxID=391736 RepID=A0ABT1H7C3_9NOCA|nr:hypothetical protein [Williamsia serinedens]MCP2163061.1 hypothetical protein [Williamsia serinedens]